MKVKINWKNLFGMAVVTGLGVLIAPNASPILIGACVGLAFIFLGYRILEFEGDE